MNSSISSVKIALVWLAGIVLALGQGSQLPKYTVATLPVASSQITYTVQVIDALNTTDCTIGGATGTARFNVLCAVKWNSSAYIWSPINTAPGGFTGLPTTGGTMTGPITFSPQQVATDTLANLGSTGPVINVLGQGVVTGGTLG